MTSATDLEPREDPLGTDELGKRIRSAIECLSRHPETPVMLTTFEFSAKHAALAGEVLSLLGTASEVSVADSAAVLRRVACLLDGDAPEVRRS